MDDRALVLKACVQFMKIQFTTVTKPRAVACIVLSQILPGRTTSS